MYKKVVTYLGNVTGRLCHSAHISRAGSFVVILALCVFSIQTRADDSAPLDQADQDTFRDLPRLDSEYQTVLNEYLKQHQAPAFNDLPALAQAVEQAPTPMLGSVLIRNNLPLVLDNARSAEFSALLAYLYDANDTATLNTLTKRINKMAGSSAASQNYFLLAKYYYQRAHWQGVRAALSKVDTKDLTIGDAQYYDLLMGYALQALKKHRQAAKSYQRVPENSPYYAYAKLNQGTAFLRQGWWSEAHLEMEAAIQSLGAKADVNFRDRLLVVLAYSQLNYEFYRDARETLRRVSLESKYTNKALMGLGLAAAHQKDFNGAINAFKLLSQKKPADLSVDEAHLLLAYAVVETGDKPSAEIIYQKSINHFQKKINTLKQLLTSLEQSSVESVSAMIKSMDSRADEIYGNQDLIPDYFLANYQALGEMQRNPLPADLRENVATLQRAYEYQLKSLVSTNLNLRKSMLESYLSQAKYGKAKLYDK